MKDVPQSHPRYQSLKTRERIVDGVEQGITSVHGLIAQGRGEAFDYLIGEGTNDFAMEAIRASAALLLQANYPVISVNGNSAALVPDELVALSHCINAPLEVNVFHTSGKRERLIAKHLERNGATRVLLPSREVELEYLESNRRFVHPYGIYRADVIFVPLEDGDRCEALRKAGKDVITVDLNPLSRTSQTASITIIDNLVRTMGVLIAEAARLRDANPDELNSLLSNYDNQKIIQAAQNRIRAGV